MSGKPFAFFLTVSALALVASCGEDITKTEHGELNVVIGSTSASDNTLTFDPVAVGDPASNRIFLVKNDAENADLKILHIKLVTASPYITITGEGEQSCAEDTCTVEPFILEPRQSRQYDLTYNPTDIDPLCGEPPPGFSADYCGHVEIGSNDPATPMVTFELRIPRLGGQLQVCITGTSNCGGQLSLDFAPATIEDPAQQRSFTIQNVGANLLSINGIDVTLQPEGEFKLLGAAAPFTLNPGTVQEITVEFKANSNDPITRGGSIVVRSNAASNPTVTLAVAVGNPNAAQIDVTPRSLAFVDVQQFQTAEKPMTITNLAGGSAAPLTVNVRLEPSTNEDYSVYDDQGNIRAGARCQQTAPPSSCTEQLIIPRSSSQVLQVRYSPQTSQASNATLLILSNDQDPIEDSSIEVALTASAAMGVLSATPAQLVWENVALGASEGQVITLRNAGSAQLTISAIVKRSFSSAGAEPLFTLSADPSVSPIVLAPEATEEVTVTFTRPGDDEAGLMHSGDLVFVHDGAGGEAIVSVGVSYP
ncbi:MAG: choice-of-anchor D domain-containing protein [Myxococcota bacterium]|jgi:hypothetical protein|nr:choice-of-anchor D domain-containing protein [Myxococcota bacterium]